MNLGHVMEEIAGRLNTITDLNAFAFPADGGHLPLAIVDYPDDYNYDETYGRGMDRMTLPVVIYLDRVVDHSTRSRVSVFVDGAGASSVKSVLESGNYVSFDTVRVMNVEFDYVRFADTECIAAVFALDIAGRGSQ